MKAAVLFTVGLLAGVCGAQQKPICAAEFEVFPFVNPKPTDRRSSCPILNALANHGFLPRDGLNISREQMLEGMQRGLGLNTTGPLQNTTARGLTMSSTGNPNTLHLDDIDKHGVIERDASLSRQDIGVGDPKPFNPTIWASALAWLPDDVVSVEQMSRAMAQRIVAANASNPKFNLTKAQEAVAVNAWGLTLLMFGNGAENNATKRHIRVLFEEERLPFAEGWRQSNPLVQASQSAEINKKIAAAMPQQRQGCPMGMA
ncbi:hypothetical protein RB598_002271 [Gaeumannomyces tritici]